MWHRLRWGDGIVIVCVLFLAGIVAFPFLVAPSNALTCEIRQGDTVIRTIELAKGYTDVIRLTQGEVTNVIQISGKTVRFLESNCPDQICVRTGTLSRAGQMAVCLPTRVMIRLVGAQKEVDAIA